MPERRTKACALNVDSCMLQASRRRHEQHGAVGCQTDGYIFAFDGAAAVAHDVAPLAERGKRHACTSAPTHPPATLPQRTAAPAPPETPRRQREPPDTANSAAAPPARDAKVLSGARRLEDVHPQRPARTNGVGPKNRPTLCDRRRARPRAEISAEQTPAKAARQASLVVAQGEASPKSNRFHIPKMCRNDRR